MTNRFRETYQDSHGLEQAILDLVRVGASGHGSGVRQLAVRLARSLPPTVEDPAAFRADLHQAIAQASQAPGLRFSPGELPVDEGAHHPLVDVDPLPDGSDLVLAAGPRRAVEEIILERARAKELAAAGVVPTRTVLISGPPGVGKTLAAKALAQRLALPLVALDLATVVSSFLGNSGRNIRAVLDYGKSGPCVLLLDEFDALAKRRDDDTDIGELKRIVNVILVELDRWPDTSLLVAATNHAHLLDEAVDRRFDRHLVLELPDRRQRREILARLAEGAQVEEDASLDLFAAITEGRSGSDLTRMWTAARRRAVLQGTHPTEEMLGDLAWRDLPNGRDRDMLWRTLGEVLGMSTRQIAQRFGVSHPTVGSAIRRAKAES